MLPVSRSKTRSVAERDTDGIERLVLFWTTLRIVVLAIIALVLFIKIINHANLWKQLQCPRVGVSNGLYQISCGANSRSDGWIPLASFPLLSVLVFLSWDIYAALVARPVTDTRPQSLCNAVVFPLLLPPIVYFGIQPCLTTILTFVALEAILRYVWYASRRSNTSMAYVMAGNVLKFIIIYTYFGYAIHIPMNTKVYAILDLVFMIGCAVVSIVAGTENIGDYFERASSVLQFIQFTILCLLSSRVAMTEINEFATPLPFNITGF